MAARMGARGLTNSISSVYLKGVLLVILPILMPSDPESPLHIAGIDIPCYVLEDGMRVVSQRGLQTSIGMSVSGGARRLTKLMSKFSLNGIDTKGLESRITDPISFRASAK